MTYVVEVYKPNDYCVVGWEAVAAFPTLHLARDYEAILHRFHYPTRVIVIRREFYV